MMKDDEEEFGGISPLGPLKKSELAEHEVKLLPNQALLITSAGNREIAKLEPLIRLHENEEGLRVVFKKLRQSVTVKDSNNQEILSGGEIIFYPGEPIITIETVRGPIIIICKSISSQYGGFKGCIFEVKGICEIKITAQE